MRLLSTSLGTWDRIDMGTKRKHGVTFPLAIVHAVLEDAGFPPVQCWEGEGPRPEGPWDVILVSALDPRHFWALGPWLRDRGIPDLAEERGESDPVVILGGQAASAPAAVEPMVDVVYLGEVEAHGPDLIAALAAGGSRRERLARAAQMPGCLVPSVHGPDHIATTVYAKDISITLQKRLWVNHRKIHRIEVARGCLGPASTPSKDPTKTAACGFCALGWRAPYRENDAGQIAAALAETKAMGINEIHLSAGDAEGHSEIVQLRRATKKLGLHDHGHAGRLDTLKDCSASAGKQFAFGMEGASHRLRRAIGKPALTDEYVIERIHQYWQGGGDRLLFHFIGELPTEGPEDYDSLAALMSELANRARLSGRKQGLAFGRQPFTPLPHTPMQWMPAGVTTNGLGAVARRYERHPHLHAKDLLGQQPKRTLTTLIAIRGGRAVAPLVRAGHLSLPSSGRALLRGVSSLLSPHGLTLRDIVGPMDSDQPTPWAHIQSAFPLETQRRSYRKMCRVLGYDPSSWSMREVAQRIAGR